MSDPRAPVARLFGHLLLRELDAATLAELREPGIASALAGLGIELPHGDDLDALAAEYFEQILRPTASPPLVHSLWRGGGGGGAYEGDAAASARRVAEALALEPGAGARGAAPDHVGCLLTLWAELSGHDPEGAATFASAHLAWVPRAVAATRATGFYSSLLRATSELCTELSGENRHAEPAPPRATARAGDGSGA